MDNVEDITKIDLNSFLEWQREKKGRSVSIELGDPSSPNYLKIWVYDYKTQVGQHVISVEEIDLDAKAKEEKRALYEKLKQEFGE